MMMEVRQGFLKITNEQKPVSRIAPATLPETQKVVAFLDAKSLSVTLREVTLHQANFRYLIILIGELLKWAIDSNVF